MSSDYRPPSVFTPFLRRFTDERARELEDTIALYHEVRRAFLLSPWSTSAALEATAQRIVDDIAQYVDLPQSPTIHDALDRCLREILALETTIFTSPQIDWTTTVLSLKEQVDLRHFLRAQQHFLANQDRVLELLIRDLGNVYAGIALSVQLGEVDGNAFTIPLLAAIDDLPKQIDQTAGTLTQTDALEAGLFATLHRHLYENVCAVSGVLPDEKRRKPLIFAPDCDLSGTELAEAYLKNTPLLDLLRSPVPFDIPIQTRFEHHWIIAPPGAGKTQTLQYLIANDLERVVDGEASIVVLDSQGDLIRNISRLKLFAAGQPLHGKLCLIDPNDIEYPVALNLFDVGMERINRYSPLDRERVLNSALEMFDFVLGALLGAEMTSRQSTLFRFATQAMLHIPDATIHTFRELMQPGGYEKFRGPLAKLTGTARDFFETQFNGKQFEQTKQQVVARLFAICQNRSFERLFSHPRSKLDLFREMNSGRVILINTAKDLLKQDGTQVFGRFFLALIANASAESATLPHSQRLPCFVYIDEAQDYIATDSNFTVILEQARKQNVGMIVAHQLLSQMSQRTLDSLYGTTSIKFAAGLSDRDAHALARNMHTEPEFIARQPKRHFAAYVRNLTSTAVSLGVPFFVMEEMQRMTGEEEDLVRNDIRVRYAVRHAENVSASTDGHEMRLDPGDVDPNAAETW